MVAAKNDRFGMNSDVLPRLKDSPSYEQWKSLLETWTYVTKVPKKQQAETIILTLEPKAQEVALKIEKTKLRTEDDAGFKELVKALDKLYVGDENQRIFTLCDEFEQFKRKSDENVSDFVTQWESKVETLNSHGVKYSEPALAYKLITAANIDTVSTRIIRSTVKDLTLASMKETILKVFDKNLINSEGNSSTYTSDTGSIEIKEEPVFFNYHDRGRAMKYRSRRPYQYGNNYGNYRNNNQDYSSYGNYRSNPDHNTSNTVRGYRNDSDKRYERGRARKASSQDYNEYRPYNKRRNDNRTVNPLDNYGNPSKCTECGSIYHWRRFCDNKKEEQYVHQAEDITVNFLNMVDKSQQPKIL